VPRKILETQALRYQNLDFKELTSSVRLTWDGYCEAIMKVAISGAQGQMSQVSTGGLWISARLQVDGEIEKNH
jgi:hypothetical protein